MRRFGWLVSLLVVLLLACAACGHKHDERAQVVPSFATPIPTATPSPTPTVVPTPTPEPTPEPPTPVTALTGFQIPRFGVRSAIERIGMLPGNQLDSPHNPYNTGWYAIFDAPGVPGNAVFAAHVDYYPNIKGPFNQLSQLRAGEQVMLDADSTQLVYEVVSNTRYTVYDIPMSEVIWPPTRPSDEQWITLITCGGRFVSSRPGGPGEYLDRDVVVARRVQ